MAALKVYSWCAFRRECRTTHSQTREIVAAKSKAEVARIVGTTVARLHNLSETRNEHDVKTAMSSPGTVFWQPVNERNGKYTAAVPTPGPCTAGKCAPGRYKWFYGSGTAWPERVQIVRETEHSVFVRTAGGKERQRIKRCDSHWYTDTASECLDLLVEHVEQRVKDAETAVAYEKARLATVKKWLAKCRAVQAKVKKSEGAL